jgi:hypothetical protein
MSHPLHILASDNGTEKAIGYAVVLGFWLLWSLASWLKKVTSGSTSRPVPRPPSLPSDARRPIPALKQALQSRPPQGRPFGQKTAPPRLKPQQRPAFSARPVPPPLPTARLAQQPRGPQPPAPRGPQPPPPPRAPASIAPPVSAQPTRQSFAASLNRWLQPSTLRTQFILTEILQPPLGLRETENLKSQI